MVYILAAALTALTLPVWGGALAAVVGAGFWLIVNFPVPFILGTVILFWLAAKAG